MGRDIERVWEASESVRAAEELEIALLLHGRERRLLEVTGASEHAPTCCDATRLSQVLNNLLSNAIKYSPEGGAVRIRVMPVDDGYCVAVTDTGVGIPSSELQSIFEPFRRSSSTRGVIPGVGLGLAVARKSLAAHGGSLDVGSEPGRGSTFYAKLPITTGTSGSNSSWKTAEETQGVP